MSTSSRNAESGNVLFYILIAVILLAALSYAVAQSGRGNVQSLSDDRARLVATEVLEFSGNVANAVAQLRLRGCSDTEISFENNVVAGYTNGTDTTCQIFHPGGGGINYVAPNEALGTGLEWYFSGNRYIDDVGTTGAVPADRAELYLFVQGITEQICTNINDMIDIENPSSAPPVGSQVDLIKFTGSYGGGNRIILPADAGYSATKGKTEFCIEENGNFTYVKVLIAR